MHSYQIFSFLIYIEIILLIYSLVPKKYIQKLPTFLKKIYFKTKYLLIIFLITLYFYIITFKKPLVNRKIINKLYKLDENTNLKDIDYNFTWDGCSGGYSAIANLFFIKVGWEEGCLIHDYSYWKGGSRKQKKDADTELYKYLIDNGYSKIFAKLIFFIISIGGQPFLPFPWRWGYGYKYPKKAFY